MRRLPALAALLFAALFAVSPAPTFAQIGEEILPPVFVETLLELPDDAAQAAKSGKRLLLYFGQVGCPYCKELMQTSFTQKAIVDKTAKHFLPIAFNFSAALDYSVQRLEGKLSFAEHMKAVPQTGASATLHEQPFFMKPPLNLARKRGDKPLAVLFESRQCAPCDELHQEGFTRDKTLAAISRLDVARLTLSGRDALTTPDGRRSNAEAWSRELKISYTPSVVFFDDRGKEVFRLEAYVRPFHFTSSFEYVASGAYRKEPEFQRFLQNKAEHMKESGEKLELWK
ncbi:MAG: thioredoxin fold domain-containing protein [Sulfuritalea sp.]|nr:thioredoxin fold domain-containing protein [Sulfuritalea sp.]